MGRVCVFVAKQDYESKCYRILGLLFSPVKDRLDVFFVAISIPQAFCYRELQVETL